MKLYYHPVSTTSRPVVLFAAESGIPLDFQVVDLFTGEQYQPAYEKINPSHQVPVLEDGDFRLTESSSILKYLADKIGSPAYPKDPRQRAHVNERMDWFNTGFYRDYSYGFIYPQIFAFMKRPDDVVQAGTLAYGQGQGAGLAQGSRPEPARPAQRLSLRRCDHGRRLSRRDDGAERRGDHLQLRRLPERHAVDGQHEEAEELVERERGVLQVRGRSEQGQGVRAYLDTNGGRR